MGLWNDSIFIKVLSFACIAFAIYMAFYHFYDEDNSKNQRTVSALVDLAFALCVVIAFIPGIIWGYIDAGLWLGAFLFNLFVERSINKSTDKKLARANEISHLIDQDGHVKILLSLELTKITNGRRASSADLNEAIKNTLNDVKNS